MHINWDKPEKLIGKKVIFFGHRKSSNGYLIADLMRDDYFVEKVELHRSYKGHYTYKVYLKSDKTKLFVYSNAVKALINTSYDIY